MLSLQTIQIVIFVVEIRNTFARTNTYVNIPDILLQDADIILFILCDNNVQRQM